MLNVLHRIMVFCEIVSGAENLVRRRNRSSNLSEDRTYATLEIQAEMSASLEGHSKMAEVMETKRYDSQNNFLELDKVSGDHKIVYLHREAGFGH